MIANEIRPACPPLPLIQKILCAIPHPCNLPFSMFPILTWKNTYWHLNFLTTVHRYLTFLNTKGLRSDLQFLLAGNVFCTLLQYSDSPEETELQSNPRVWGEVGNSVFIPFSLQEEHKQCEKREVPTRGEKSFSLLFPQWPLLCSKRKGK